MKSLIHIWHRTLDRMLEFLWAWFGVRRWAYSLVTGVVWIVAQVVFEVMRHGKLSLVSTTLSPILAVMVLWNVWQMRKAEHRFKDHLDIYNGAVISQRETTSRVFFDVLILIIFALGVPGWFHGMIHHSVGIQLIDVASDIGFILFNTSYVLLVPMGPRKKIKLPKLSMPKVNLSPPTPAYGGSWG